MKNFLRAHHQLWRTQIETMEETVRFSGGDHILEGLLAAGSKPRAVVACHPHPQYGGDMRNNVVEALTGAWRQQGHTTLRFNFRGVGESGGAFSGGPGEAEDLRDAVSFLSARGAEVIDLAGYSFGAWIIARADVSDLPVGRIVWVSPPVAFMDFSGVGEIPRLSQVITGDRDEIAPPAAIRNMLPRWNAAARFDIIEGADHFFVRREPDLITTLTGAFL